MSGNHESVELVGDETVEYFAKAVLIAVLTAALAQISIPVPGTTVPFSLQPFGAFFAGLLLGPVWGGLAMALYVAAGAAGAPIYSNGAAGIGHLFGSTGGFLIGFLVGAVVIGAVAHRSVTPRSLETVSVPVQVAALGAGLLVIYVVGIPWMSAITGLSLARATAVMVPFVIPDVVKLAIAVGVVRGGYLVRG